jgi:peptidoglycan hydrolase-like protein with peptidoglycan-binding domain
MTMKINMKIKYLSILSFVLAFTFSSVLFVHAQTTGSSYKFNQNLTIGSTGPDVIALQHFLINKGYLTSISTPTGYFGNGTQTALSQFQSANGISPASGYVGPKTRIFLNLLTASISSLSSIIGGSSSSIAIGDTPSSTTSTDVSSNQGSSQVDPPVLPINPQVIVGIVCYADLTYTNQNTGYTVTGPSNTMWDSGSGVIIDKNGDILTNRHIVILADQFTTITDNNGNNIPVKISARVNHCDVGQLPASSILPTTDQIQTINPYVQLSVLGYTAQPAFISNPAGLSDNEIGLADFAILKITGVSQSGPTFGIASVPSSFPYATFLPVQPLTKIDGLVVTYGFPGNISQGQGNFFQTLIMEGSIGHFLSMDFGDDYYADTPLTIHTNMEIAHGRSGSPLFWRGYVIGLVTRFDDLDNINYSASVATDAIAKGLRNSGYSLSISGSPATTEINQSQSSYQVQQPDGYQVCSNTYSNETWDGTYNSSGKFNCICLVGYVTNSSQTGCVLRPSCPIFSSYNSGTKSCTCNTGYTSYDGQCVSGYTYCTDKEGYGANYDAGTNSCTCDTGYIYNGGQCEAGSLYCSNRWGVGAEYDYSTGGCACGYGYESNGSGCISIYPGY